MINGRATQGYPGQRVVLYAKSGVWWVQPSVDNPYTAVQADSTWKSQTHPGSAYAALLVTQDYHPRRTTEVLPEKGGAVLAVVVAEGRKTVHAAGKTAEFAGYEWHIRENPSDPGGTPNDYDPANAWTDRRGFLHLRIAGRPGNWTSAEVSLPRGLGYGSYRFILSDVSHLEPAAVLTMATLNEGGLSHEMDIEISKWGEKNARNGQFVIQPYYIPANTARFQAPAGTLTFMLRWAPERATFRVFRGRTAEWESRSITEHVFTSGVPPAADDSIHMNLYVFGHNSNPLQRGTEVIVEKFEYLP